MSNMTRIAVDLPEDIAKRLQSAWRDLSRGALEAVAVEGYRDGTLSREQVGRVLGLSFWETDAFLKERQAYLAYDEQDLEQDRRDLDRLGPR
jgi:predicted HTH domain antitoxin